MVLAAAGALMALAVLFLGNFSFIRVVDLVQMGQARQSIQPKSDLAVFLKQRSRPPLGWAGALGAGKVVVPVNHGIAQLIGTNAAHNEYLRIGCEGGLFGTALLVICMALWAYRGARGLPSARNAG